MPPYLNQLNKESGKRLLLTEEERFDPVALYNAMELAPTRLHHYNSSLQSGLEELRRIATKRKELEAIIEVWCHEEVRGTRAPGATRSPTAKEIQIYFDRITSQEQVFLEGPTLNEAQQSTIDEFRLFKEEERSWTSRIAQLEVLVESWRSRCSMLRSQSGLMQSMLQQNLIDVPRGQVVTWSDNPDRLGPEDRGVEL